MRTQSAQSAQLKQKTEHFGHILAESEWQSVCLIRNKGDWRVSDISLMFSPLTISKAQEASQSRSDVVGTQIFSA